MSGRALRFFFASTAAWLAGAGTPAKATWQDDIGYSQLAAELGASLPQGTGVQVTQVEAQASDEGEYRPSESTSPTTGNFAGKSFVFRSGAPAAVSGHAARLGNFFYGLNVDVTVGDASVAPLAGTGPAGRVLSFEASDWMRSGFLRWNAAIPDNPLLPRSESGAIANHSWISSIDNSLTGPQANELLRRLDYSVGASDYVAAVGVNNGSGSSVPPLLASGYNVISVGLTNGEHSVGTTPDAVDGGGRAKPELVAPMSASSWATGVVSSCTAVLQQMAASFTPASVATDAQHSVVLRAVLLAGASKRPFLTPEGVLTWSRTNTRPLDSHYGAGEVNLRRSYQVLAAGEFAPGGSQVGPAGWHYESALPPTGERTYFLLVPPGCVAREISGALVWNRRITFVSGGVWSAPAPELANLDLRLHDSAGLTPGLERAVSMSGAEGSVPHPLEHVYVRDLPAGEYALRVTSAGPSTTDYGLAWLCALEPAQPPAISATVAGDGSTLSLTLSQLGIGLTYVLQTSGDLANWATVQTLDATRVSATSVAIAAGGRGFFRLLWVPRLEIEKVGADPQPLKLNG